jgi:hypothetical protein
VAGTDRRAGRERAARRVRKRGGLPPILEAEDRRVGGHRVEHEVGRSVAPSTDHRAAGVLVDAACAHALAEALVAEPSRDLDDDVNVDGRARRGRGGIGDPEHDRRAADEHDLVQERPERCRGALEQVDAHARAAGPSRRARR